MEVITNETHADAANPGTLPADLLDEVHVPLKALYIDAHYPRLYRLMKEHLSAMNYDANKLPLGKLSKNTILSGFTALKVRISVYHYDAGLTGATAIV